MGRRAISQGYERDPSPPEQLVEKYKLLIELNFCAWHVVSDHPLVDISSLKRRVPGAEERAKQEGDKSR